MLDFTMFISFYLTMFLGILVLLFASLYVWDRVFTKLLSFFEIKALFFQFMYDYYKGKKGDN